MKGALKMSDYPTWYEFKRDLEKRVGHCVVNTDWLRVKPAAPLPWDKPRLRSAIQKLSRIEKRRISHITSVN